LTRFYRKETCDGLERLDELKKSALFETLVQLVKSIHLLVLCVIFIYAKLAEFKAVGEQVVLALRETGEMSCLERSKCLAVQQMSRVIFLEAVEFVILFSSWGWLVGRCIII
jgi:hypothetical protein